MSVPIALLGALGPPPLDPAPVVEMCEGVEGMWRYHLREPGKVKSLCGRTVMLTPAPLDSWGFMPGHMPTSYCWTCRARAGTP